MAVHCTARRIAAALIEPSLWPVGAAIGGGSGLAARLRRGDGVDQGPAEGRSAALGHGASDRRVCAAGLWSLSRRAPESVGSRRRRWLRRARGRRPSASLSPSESPLDSRRVRVGPSALRSQGWRTGLLWRLIAGQNALVRVRVRVSVSSCIFLLLLAYSHLQVPIEVRMLAVAAGGAVLFGIGWRLRARRRGLRAVAAGRRLRNPLPDPLRVAAPVRV